ncbi:hypothetical protein D3C77_538060 [compost metagenome]
MVAVMLEVALFVLHIGKHGAHEMRLVNPGESEADAVGALVQAKRHRHRHGTLQLACRADFTEVLEQHIAAQRVTDGEQGRLRTLRPKVCDGLGEVFAGAGMVAAREQVGLT